MEKQAKGKFSKSKSRTSNTKSSRNGRSRKKGSFESLEPNAVPSVGDNDWKWYANNEYILRDTASFSYNYPLGSRSYYGENAGAVANSFSIPGVMAIATSPTIGYAQTANDPINIAANNIYSYILHANSRSYTYNAPDLMQYILAMSNAYAFLAYLKRGYGILNTGSYTNRYLPTALMYAHGFDYQDMITHIADFRAFINIYATKLSALCVPAKFSYVARLVWEYSNIFTDTPVNDKAQMYLFVPEGLYQYCEETRSSQSVGFLKWLPIYEAPIRSEIIWPGKVEGPSHRYHSLQFDDLRQIADDLLNPILESETFQLISGDILKAYGSDQLYKITYVEEAYQVQPIYSEEVLDQINNTTLMGRSLGPTIQNSRLTPATNDIYQDSTRAYLKADYKTYLYDIERGDALSWEEEFTQTGEDGIFQVYASDKLINFRHGAVSPADTMVATRLTNTPESVGNWNLREFVDGDSTIWDEFFLNAYTDPGSDVRDSYWAYREFNWDSVGATRAGFAKIFYWAYPNRGQNKQWSLIQTDDIYSVIWSITRINPGTIGSASSLVDISWKPSDDVRRFAMLSVFDRHPAVSYTHETWYFDDGSEEWRIYRTAHQMNMNDVNYYTVLDREDLNQINLTAILNMFSPTEYGKAVI